MKKRQKKHVFHLRRLGLFAALFVAFAIVRLDSGTTKFASAHVLAYASEMSRSGLLSGTNNARSANGFAPLSLNSQLNSSAQAKAQDMANKDYWAHVAPDGTQPWYFFEQAGYSYIKAGENLAYGFTTSQGAIDGWMNSATHRANVLGDYYDVGFGIVNAPNYQSSGEQTIVVAHYGTQQAATPAPAPVAPVAPAAPVAPTATPTPTTTPIQPSAAQEAPTATTPAPVATDNSLEQKTTTAQPTKTNDKQQTTLLPVSIGATTKLSVLDMIRAKQIPLMALMSLVIISFTVVGYALTHRSAFQHAMSSGEHFVITHPGVDSSVIAAMTTLILLTTYGHIG